MRRAGSLAAVLRPLCSLRPLLSQLLSPEALWVCLEHAQQAALNHKALFFHSPRLPAGESVQCKRVFERNRIKKKTSFTPPCAANLTREEENERNRVGGRCVGLGSRGGINQQAGLIRPSNAGFLSPQQAGEADKAPPLSSSSSKEKKNIKHKERITYWLWGFRNPN